MNSLYNLDHSYGTSVVFADATVELPGRGTVALRGSNGCGKTTLLKLLGGIIASTAQSVKQWRAQRNAVYLDLEFLSLEHLNVQETLRMVAPLLRQGWGRECPLIDPSMRTTLVGDLSLGQRQRLVLTIALGLQNVDVLLLDEPFNGLDGEARAQARELLTQAGSQCLVLLATHEIEHWTEYDLTVVSPSSCHLEKAATV